MASWDITIIEIANACNLPVICVLNTGKMGYIGGTNFMVLMATMTNIGDNNSPKL